MKKFIRFLWALLNWVLHRPGRGVSVIIPFHVGGSDGRRLENWLWLQQYWENSLPGAEFVVGHDEGVPFSKSVAINNAVKRSHGSVLVIVDADCYIQADVVLDCVKRIRQARDKGQRLWFVPYRKFYRTTKTGADKVLASDPANPWRVPDPPGDDVYKTNVTRGHWFGAGIQIMPREAFETVGGWDPRFRGWGGEDHAFMRAVDTLWWRHKTTSNAIYHLWHPMLGPGGVQNMVTWKDRMWEGQTDPNYNSWLSYQYSVSYGRYDKMRDLVDDGLSGEKHKRHHHKHHHHRKSF